jgi:hypothetical protein
VAFVLRDRVQETTATTGTGTITLAGAVAGYQAFSAIGNANTCYYTIVSGVLWESGIGTYTLAGTTLARTTILASSSGTTAITLAGTSTVFCGLPAGQQIPSAAYLTGVAGTNTITASLPVMGAYIIGQVFTLVPVGANTGAVTLNINSRGAIAVTKGGATALTGGELVTGAAYQLVYDGTRFLISNTPGRILQTSYYVDGGNAPGGTVSVNPTYVNASASVWNITPISATSVLIFNISFQLQVGIVAATNTIGYCNIYVGTAATPTTAAGRYTYATTTTIGAASASTAVFTFQLASGSTALRAYGVSACTSNAGAACLVQNITGTCVEIQL